MQYIELICIIILLGFSAFFSCAETSLTALSKHQLSHIKNRKIKGWKTAAYLKENPGIMLATILIGNNLVNIALTTLGTLFIMKLLQGFGIESEIWTAIITTFSVAFFVLVFGEVTPKTVGLSRVQKFALISSRIIVPLSYLFKPLVFVLNKFSNAIIFLFGGHQLGKNTLMTEDELLSIIEAGQETGVIEKEEKDMLHDVIRFGDSFVGEIMTPLDNVISAMDTDTISTLLNKIKDRLPSRIPIYSGKKYNIIGILYLKDLLQNIATADYADYKQKQIKDFKDLIRPPFIAYIDQKSAHLMRHMRFQHIHIAIVQNHIKKTVGIVTFEDLLEEIVGEIQDEYEKN